MKKKKRKTKTLSSLFGLTNTYHSSVLDLINLIMFMCYSLVYHAAPSTISRLFLITLTILHLKTTYQN